MSFSARFDLINFSSVSNALLKQAGASRFILATFQEIAMMTNHAEQYPSAPSAPLPIYSSETVSVTDLDLVAADGVPLTARLYSGANPVKLTVLMLPGIGVPQRAFRHLADWLARRGARCVTVDYRGIGQSATPEGIQTASLLKWAQEDAAAAMAFCRNAGPEPVVLIGHSFGGQSVGLTEALSEVRAAVFIGSQFGQARHWDGAEKWRLAMYWHIFLPLVSAFYQVLPRWSGPAGRLPRGVAREWARWGRSSNWYVSNNPESVDLLAHFSAPILAYGMTDDLIAPPRAVSALLDRFYATAPDLRSISPEQLGLKRIGHTGLLRPSKEVEVIWREMFDFLLREIESRNEGIVPSAA